MSVPDLPWAVIAILQQADRLEFMTIGQVAALCDVSQKTVQEWIGSGLLPVHHVGDGSMRVTALGLGFLYALRQLGLRDFPKPDLPENA